MHLPTVTLQFRCRDTVTEEAVQNILKSTSDYQHDNITVNFSYDISEVTIYTEDINDQARTRDALHKLVDFLMDH